MEHEEILTPVRLFRTRLRGEHARNLEAAFGALLERLYARQLEGACRDALLREAAREAPTPSSRRSGALP